MSAKTEQLRDSGSAGITAAIAISWAFVCWGLMAGSIPVKLCITVLLAVWIHMAADAAFGEE